MRKLGPTSHSGLFLSLLSDKKQVEEKYPGLHVYHLRCIIEFNGEFNRLWSFDMEMDKSVITMQGGDSDRGDDPADGGTSVVTRTKTKVKKPSLYRVLLLNDDFTPMHFVIHVLQRFFAMNEEQATQVTLHVHNKGVGECGVFTYEVAETKVSSVMNFARSNEHPLQCVMEKK